MIWMMRGSQLEDNRKCFGGWRSRTGPTLTHKPSRTVTTETLRNYQELKFPFFPEPVSIHGQTSQNIRGLFWEATRWQTCVVSVDMWEPLWPLAALLPFRWRVSHLLLLSHSNTVSPSASPFLFVSFCSPDFLFMTNSLPHPPLFPHLHPLYSLYHHPAPSSSFVCGFAPPPPLVSSLLQCSPAHVGWHHSHHAVSVPRWTKGWIWFPAVQELHVSRYSHW